MFPFYTCKRLKEEGHVQILYQFKNYKITKAEISKQADKIVMIVRPSMQIDLENIHKIEGGNLIYSMWEGYLKKSDTKKFVDYLTSRNFTIYNIHTSGHADTETLKKMVEAIKPKNNIPIHTFSGSEYEKTFTTPIVEMNDGETKEV